MLPGTKPRAVTSTVKVCAAASYVAEKLPDRVELQPRFDFSGTSPVVDRGINVPLCYTRAYCYFCFKTIVAPNIPNNQAILDFVSVAAPDNCILNAKRPYATGGRHILGHYVAPLVFGALADATPDHVQADCGMICPVRKLALIVNPVAGGGRPARALPDVQAALRAKGLEQRFEYTKSLEHAREFYIKMYPDYVSISEGVFGTKILFADW